MNGTVRRHDAFVEAGTTAMDPVLHYIWSLLAEALRYEITWTLDGEPTTASPNEPLLFDYLLKNSGFDSNPCRAKCMLNPAYNIVPRDNWVEQAALCQAAADFLYDHSPSAARRSRIAAPTRSTRVLTRVPFCLTSPSSQRRDPHSIVPLRSAGLTTLPRVAGRHALPRRAGIIGRL